MGEKRRRRWRKIKRTKEMRKGVVNVKEDLIMKNRKK
jgi:hypothetical protein